MASPCADPKAWCKLCTPWRGYPNPEGVYYHAHVKHHGVSRGEYLSLTPPEGLVAVVGVANVGPEHAIVDPPAPLSAKPFRCGICNQSLRSFSSLDQHGYRVHKPQGYARKAWINGQVEIAPAPTVTVTDGPDAEAGKNVVETVATATVIPVEELAGLPWVKFPRSVAGCEEALDLIAIMIERAAGEQAISFAISLRTYIAALRKRIIGIAA